MTATNKPMTGEQLDELMTVAVNMQRTSEEIKDRGAAMFAYAVQVAVMEVRDTRSKLADSQREFRAADATIENLQMQVEKLAAENVGLKAAITAVSKTSEECELNGDELKYVVEPSEFDALTDLLDETPATDTLLAEVRASGVDAAIAHLHKNFEGTGRIGVPVMALEWLAKELRQGVQS